MVMRPHDANEVPAWTGAPIQNLTQITANTRPSSSNQLKALLHAKQLP
jgi:hypothetical protein